MITKQAYLIESLAPLVFRSGKPFGAQSSRQDIIFPLPSSSAGLIRALSIEQSNEQYQEYTNKLANEDYQKLLSIKSQGPFLVRFNPQTENHTILVPKPANALYLEDKDSKQVKLVRLQPEAFDEHLCGCDLPEGLLPIQPEEKDLKGKPQSGANYWTLQHLLDWQQNKPLDFKTVNDEGLNSIPLDIRTHVALDDQTLSSADGKLFQTASFDLGHNKLKTGGWSAERYGFLVVSEQQLGNDLASFGGERRLSNIKPIETQLPQIPTTLLETINKAKGFSLTLLTPSIFAQGYLPNWINKETLKGLLPNSTVEVQLKGVAIDRWLPVSGWDSIEWKPKATRKAVAAGAVYWFELCKPIDEKTLQQLWLTPLTDHIQDQRDGFGVAMLASWKSI